MTELLSGDIPCAAKKKRRTWTQEEENQLLQYYFSARNDASLKSDKGIKSKAWTLIVSRLKKDGVKKARHWECSWY
ncbi:hypothetical protein PPTG_22094 [Phytophthora nicotianae INRA-310]|uniref:Uncharacterized protein n=1 Tax=Phytophthora nicotianae (strain INRA-310) TaxID=761204 RepID=W2QQJ4_PHYN3|nr:hypothetical protein PPTG_22094 [Phytophthora nicotianae INRA-310]ETN15226.1 hypothetical protein PPTG_22094 [Phytophthora nicotianae INRA-310]